MLFNLGRNVVSDGHKAWPEGPHNKQIKNN